MPTSPSGRPVVALACGDPSGIGPEIIIKSLASPSIRRLADFVVIGDSRVLRRTASSMGSGRRRLPANARVADMGNVQMRSFSFGREKAAYGKASVEYIEEAYRMVASGAADCMVTAPINKSSARKSGFKFPGHTEFLAELSGRDNPVMMLVGGPLKVSLVTRHIALSEVSGRLTTAMVAGTIKTTLESIRSDFGISAPKIGVAALNPHAGEGGIFGREEIEVVRPAVKKFTNAGASGPIPADALFYDAYRGRFDAVVCLYHDQGLIPLKMIARSTGVNVTLGLGFVRTSPDHGTGFDIAGKDAADPRSMEEAIKLAVFMAAKHGKDAYKKRN